MIDLLLRWFARLSLWLRYRIRTVGMEAVAAGGTKGTLFLPNHPALIDPIILGTVLHRRFRARFLADEEQIDRFFIRRVARRINVIPIPDPAKQGPAARQAVEAGLEKCVEALRNGDNVVLYPSGQILRGRLTNLRGNSAVQFILARLPDVRVVLVRTTGLWGSLFSYAPGRMPNVAEVMRKAAVSLLASAVVFMPRRRVTIELRQPDDLPRGAGREELNRYLEAFYNAVAPPATYVPCTVWERGGVREMPEPDFGAERGDLSAVPPSSRRIVADYLREQTGVREIRDEQHLARDLGLDSLARADLLGWLAGEFGFPPGDVEALETVGDVMLAACGESFSARLKELKPVAARWFSRPERPGLAEVPEGRTIPQVFLAQARRGAARAVVADQRSGLRTYRDVVTAVFVLRPRIAELPGERVGIMLPAGVAADVVYLATLFAGKTPVMINWTVGPRNLAHCVGLVDVRHVLTAGALTARLESMGTDLSPVADRLVPLERLAGGVSRAAKLWAWARAHAAWSRLDRAAAGVKESDPAVILFTSGSETLPKAVPLTHGNILANLRDIAALRIVRRADRLLGILPPFHSFGLTVTTVLPLCVGVPVAHHPDPTEAPLLARLIDAYPSTSSSRRGRRRWRSSRATA
jgi:acyl-[acyl-carrier-protein]-phospholipid O-acyltransferase/long-chain-fatty-acid--[acyl-carrier-protein] ligase